MIYRIPIKPIALAAGTLALSLAPLAGAYAAINGAPPALTVKSQPANGKTISIAEVDIPRDGFVVIHASKNGKPVAPQHVGYAPVKAGDHKFISVTLDQIPQPGTTYIAMLHEDTGQKGKFEFGPGHTDVDKPMMKNGKPVTMPFTIEK